MRINKKKGGENKMKFILKNNNVEMPCTESLIAFYNKGKSSPQLASYLSNYAGGWVSRYVGR